MLCDSSKNLRVESQHYYWRISYWFGMVYLMALDHPVDETVRQCQPMFEGVATRVGWRRGLLLAIQTVLAFILQTFYHYQHQQ